VLYQRRALVGWVWKPCSQSGHPCSQSRHIADGWLELGGGAGAWQSVAGDSINRRARRRRPRRRRWAAQTRDLRGVPVPPWPARSGDAMTLSAADVSLTLRVLQMCVCSLRCYAQILLVQVCRRLLSSRLKVLSRGSQ
jgi:hypothetical protein